MGGASQRKTSLASCLEQQQVGGRSEVRRGVEIRYPERRVANGTARRLKCIGSQKIIKIPTTTRVAPCLQGVLQPVG